MTEGIRRQLVLIVLSLFLVTVIAGCITDLDPRMFSSSYRYELEIRADHPLTNVTFIIPLPVKNNTPMIGQERLTENAFRQDGVSIEFSQSPPDLNKSDIRGLDGYDPWFVIIRSNETLPRDPWNYVCLIEKDVYRFHNSPLFSVNTLYPIGNESLITPKYNFTWKNPQAGEMPNWNVRYIPQSIPEKTAIFSHYTTSDTTRVSVSLSLQGRNTWKQGYDDWVGNTYSEFYSGHYTGPQNGWILINGEMQLLDGVYPNPAHPEWQKALNRAPE